MNMFKESKATTVKKYLEDVPDNRKKAVLFLHKFIQETVPNLKVHFAYNMIGYGSFPYTNYKKEKLRWPTIALANQKNYISIYVCALEKGEYLAVTHKDKLGNVNVGKSCIRIKKFEDINLDVLKEIILLAADNPGFAGVGETK